MSVANECNALASLLIKQAGLVSKAKADAKRAKEYAGQATATAVQATAAAEHATVAAEHAKKHAEAQEAVQRLLRSELRQMQHARRAPEPPNAEVPPPSKKRAMSSSEAEQPREKKAMSSSAATPPRNHASNSVRFTKGVRLFLNNCRKVRGKRAKAYELMECFLNNGNKWIDRTAHRDLIPPNFSTYRAVFDTSVFDVRLHPGLYEEIKSKYGIPIKEND